MSSHSRLGRGLGSLFPEINAETPSAAAKAAKDAAKEEENAKGDAAKEAEAKAAASKTAAKPSEPLEAIFGKDDAEPRDSAQSAKAKSATTAVADGAAHSGKHHGRPVMPSLADSIHPSNVFFADDRKPTPKDVNKPQKEPATPASTVETATMHEQVAADAERASGKSAAPAAATANEEEKDGKKAKPGQIQLSGAYYTEIPVSSIGPNEHQPRTIFDEEELKELAESIKEVGVLEPIVVRKRDGWEAPYELIMGERRLRATKMAGLDQIPAIVRTTSDENMLRDALLENLHRVALNPLEEAAAYEQMIEDFHITHEQLAKSVSKSRPQITNTLRLLQLPASVQKKVAAGVLSAGHARALLALTDESEVEPLANKIIAEGLSVRSTEEIVALKNGAETKQKRRKKTNPWAGSDTVRRLEDQFETKVEIRGTQKKGKIEITFSSPEDLDRILGLINGQDSSSAAGPAGDGWV